MSTPDNWPNTVSLIGMPGSGKSTVGVLLAKHTGRRFVDTDLDIQCRENADLQTILETQGYRHLRLIEEQVIGAVLLERAIIATGGSAVYSEPCMQRLKQAGPVVYLQVDLPTLEERVAGAPPRGIASDPETAFDAIFSERSPLYKRYADVTIDASTGTAQQVAHTIYQRLGASS